MHEYVYHVDVSHVDFSFSILHYGLPHCPEASNIIPRHTTECNQVIMYIYQ